MFQSLSSRRRRRTASASPLEDPDGCATQEARLGYACTHPDGYSGVVLADRYLYFAPLNYDASNFSGEVLRYDTVECLANAECEDGERCTTHQCKEGVCEPCEYWAADVNMDCTVGIFDVFCVLNAFGGDDSCSTCP